ncbi:GlsB/YeaQ/YmgE family stress response membrane protein [Thermaurantiacus sp.]
MGWIWALVIGFLSGALARLVSRDPRNPTGCLMTTLLGIAGAFLFTWLGQQIGLYGEGDRAGLIGSVIGAILVLLIWRQLVEKAR